jgi:hypothetical protein
MVVAEFLTEWFESNAPEFDPEIRSDDTLLVYLATS